MTMNIKNEVLETLMKVKDYLDTNAIIIETDKLNTIIIQGYELEAIQRKNDLPLSLLEKITRYNGTIQEIIVY